MALRLPFRKVTPEGLSVDIEQFEGLSVLILTKNAPGASAKPAQIIGLALREINTPTITWYYEYDPLPREILPRLVQHLEMIGYSVGVFDQFGNFRAKAA